MNIEDWNAQGDAKKLEMTRIWLKNFPRIRNNQNLLKLVLLQLEVGSWLMSR